MKSNKAIQLFSLLSILFVTACKKEEVTTTTTTQESPSVVSTSPSNNSSGIFRNSSIVLTFNVAMDTASIRSGFSLKLGAAAVAGKFTYTSTTATFTPNDNFAALTKYTASLSTGVKNTSGKSLAASSEWTFITGGSLPGPTGLAPVNLGAAGNFVILAKTAINNSPTSSITGDLGISPAAESYITGFSQTDATGYATSSQVTGKIYAADMVAPTPTNLTTSVNNMVTAYNDAAGRPSPDFFELGTGNIGGKTLAAGLYKWTNTVSVPSNITISGGADDIWIFQIAGNLTVSSAVKITLSGGAQAKNIFWQVAGEVTIGTTASFQGVIMSMTGITLKTGASLNGRALAQSAVILDGNIVTKP